MKKLIIVTLVCLLAGCINMNMNKDPDRWVTVLDADSGKPIPGVSLVYISVRKPYFIVGEVMISRKYTTDANGKAHVPSGVRLMTDPGCGYVDLPSSLDGKSDDQQIIYIMTYQDYMKKMKEPEPAAPYAQPAPQVEKR